MKLFLQANLIFTFKISYGKYQFLLLQKENSETTQIQKNRIIQNDVHLLIIIFYPYTFSDM
jgi:hypothetical protein